jgi:hypothetical protein
VFADLTVEQEVTGIPLPQAGLAESTTYRDYPLQIWQSKRLRGKILKTKA